MTQLMAAVNSPGIEHGLLLELSLQNPNWDPDLPEGPSNPKSFTYYISNCYQDVVYNGRTYTALAGFLQVGELQQDISAGNNEINIGMSAIPPEYITAILGAQIKGGAVRILRVFFDPVTQLVAVINGVQQIFPRFAGYITNYSVSEEVSQNVNGGDVSHTITVIASSTNGILENRVSGRRTNRKSYQYRYDDLGLTFNNGLVLGPRVFSTNVVTDTSLNRIETLHNASFDFGKPVKK